MSALIDNYHLGLSLIAWVSILAFTLLSRKLGTLNPVFARASTLNQETYEKKMQRRIYADNQKVNRKWGLVDSTLIFLLIIPFCITAEPQPLWQMALDMFVILMFYDFFYYLTHRFLFHDGGLGKGPLMWMHAVHHQQKNPCRGDSSYIHPLEVAIGLGLYAGSILVLSQLMGEFHIATIIFTWIIFSEINNHNHDLWEEERFPYKYLSYMSKMHHYHHARFVGGNFGTISLFYDWLFRSYDTGNGWGKNRRTPQTPAQPGVDAAPVN